MGRRVAALRVAVTLELVIAHGPSSRQERTTAADGGPRARGCYAPRMPALPHGPTPRRHVQAVRLCPCHRRGRRLTARTNKLLRTMYRAHLRTCR
jgi:hypothetical protein